MGKLRKNHKFLSAAGHVRSVCQPLQYLQTHMFTYMKNFLDGTQVYLSSDARWIEDYYTLKLHDSSFFEGDPAQYVTGFKWWPEGSDLPVFTHGRDYFNSLYGITFCRQEKDGCEFFFFSSGRENTAKMDVYLNHLDLLEEFTVYFKEKTAPLLQTCSNHRVTRRIRGTNQMQQQHDVQRELFLQAIGMHHAALNQFLGQYEPLTAREKECLFFMMDELSTANIADAMHVSIRTAETHIYHIKQKLHCRTKYELLAKLFALHRR
jgi:DNA-binding CsgD family transcriptional regulator